MYFYMYPNNYSEHTMHKCTSLGKKPPSLSQCNTQKHLNSLDNCLFCIGNTAYLPQKLLWFDVAVAFCSTRPVFLFMPDICNASFIHICMYMWLPIIITSNTSMRHILNPITDYLSGLFGMRIGMIWYEYHSIAWYLGK